MYLDFSNELYKIMAINTSSVNYENDVSPEDAFLIVLKDLDYETIDNLCTTISNKISINDSYIVYEMIQNDNIDDSFKRLVLETAYEIIHSNKFLGNKVVNGKFNASSWISHSLFEGEVASQLSNLAGLNPDVGMKLGILHDIGRKFDHSFMHTIKGYEYLSKLGLKDDAYCCLTHSFLSIPENGIYKGNRCANCDPALDGFYVNNKGQGVFKEDSKIDDITVFLNNYCYNLYDIILNISDLMATSNGIVSPYDRVMDVYSRKSPDERNSPFFKVSFINTLNKLLFLLTKDTQYDISININDFSSVDEIDSLLNITSDKFYNKYNMLLSFIQNENINNVVENKTL